jgi:hypothetical protein
VNEPSTDTTREGQQREGEKWRWERRSSDVLGQVVWAAILVFAGLVFLADNFGYLPGVREADPWEWIMLGAGGLLLLESLIRLISPDFQGPATGRLILGLILLALGASAIFGVNLSAAWWPVIIIVIGVSLLMRGRWR